MTDYAELHCLTNFSFQRGASHPHELVERAAALGYRALAVTDECSFAASVRAHEAAKEHDLKLIHGTELRLADGPKVVLLACDHAGYSALCWIITRGRRAATKGCYRLHRQDLEGVDLGGCLALLVPTYAEHTAAADQEHADWLAQRCPGRTWVAVELHCGPDDTGHLAYCSAIAGHAGLPLVAAGDVHMHVRGRRALQDVLTAVRLGCPVAEAGHALFPNGERYLRPRSALAEIYPAELLAETLTIAEHCHFSLDELAYRYPHEVVPAGRTPAGQLRTLVEDGIAWRWPDGISQALRDQVERELALIAEMGYEHYFLTVHDLIAFARSQGILCQGRGSAANSAVCYCLGITDVDPVRHQLLFERFISRERDEPPDIDVDFEHQRREEVIQYIYAKYGRERAALAATVITYQPRSAIRDVGKALGLPLDQVDAIAKAMAWWESREELDTRLRELGYDPDAPVLRQLVVLVETLLGFPRHLSQHVGGFVLSDTPLYQLVPVENAAMPERTIIQWDKDDLEALGLLKVDVLALGMLSCLRRCFDLVADFRGVRHDLASIPAKDPDTYAMIQRADTVGVFQIESRAQQAMLPRLEPRRFFDLVISIAIVRPGPIQGGMVHPYLRRRRGLEPETYPSEALERVLKRTLGVPIFQEQVMQIAVVAAGFTPGEADALRRAMAAWKRRGGLEPFRERLMRGMAERGYSRDFAERIFEQIKGFGSYGFPESHAISFALLVYVSAYLKCHEPAAFACALLNSQPMGFYAPAQIVADARRHDVEVRPVDVTTSDWDCTLERRADGKHALRLGLRMVKDLSAAGAQRLVKARDQGAFTDVESLVHRVRLDRRDAQALARADALAPLAGHRHGASWAVAGVERLPALLQGQYVPEPEPELPAPSEGKAIVDDYATVGLTLRHHPLALLRPRLHQSGVLSAEEFGHALHNQVVAVAGLVTIRQRPSTANGVIFITLEDETGRLNVIIWPKLSAKYRQAVLGARLLHVKGVMQREGLVQHCLARHLEDWSELLGRLPTTSRDFH